MCGPSYQYQPQPNLLKINRVAVDLANKNVRACKFDFGITRPKKRKDTKTATAAPLITFGDLKFTIDRKWVAAAPVISNVVKPNSRKAPGGESNRGRAPEASQLAQGIKATNRKQDRGPRKRRTAHKSKSV